MTVYNPVSSTVRSRDGTDEAERATVLQKGGVEQTAELVSVAILSDV